jgi:O-antigen/teichoic acid export membrane protein
MLRHLKAAAQSRLIRAILVGAYGQGIQIILQLLTVPFMIGHWGTEHYGVWLALYVLPSYLAMTDFGLTNAAANDMVMKMARHERDESRDLYQAVRRLRTIVTAALFLVCAGAVYGPFAHWLDFAQEAARGRAQLTLLVLLAYGLTALSSSVIYAGYRAMDSYAFGGTIMQTVSLTENILLLVSVIIGGSMLQAACVLLIVRSAGVVLAHVILRRRNPWFLDCKAAARLSLLRPLLKPASGNIALMFANVMMIQSPVLLITSLLGPGWVPMFTTVRTLTRFPLQFSIVLGQATLTRFCVAHGMGDERRKAKLALFNIVISGGILGLTVPVLLFMGPWIIQQWTHHAITADRILLTLMTFTMLANEPAEFRLCL